MSTDSHTGYMLLSRFLDLLRKRTSSLESADLRLEYLLYQLSLAMLREERTREEENACAAALMELEPLNRLLMEGERGGVKQGDIDRDLVHGLTRIVERIGGETQCSIPTMHRMGRPFS